MNMTKDNTAINTTNHESFTPQDKVYSFVESYIQQNGYAPVVREISTGVNICQSTVFKCINNLVDEGLLVKDSKNCVRNLCLPNWRKENGRLIPS